MGKTVLYHQEGREPKAFAVLKKHDDGTIDIGPENGEPVVTGARILEEPRFGFCTAAETPATDASDSLADKNVNELRDICVVLAIDPTGLKKAELIAAIEAAKKK